MKVESGKLHISKPVVPQQSGLQQNVFGVPTLIGFFFDGFGVGKTLNDVQLGWYANGDGVVNGVVTNIDIPNQKITIADGRGLFLPGLSYRFYNIPQ